MSLKKIKRDSIDYSANVAMASKITANEIMVSKIIQSMRPNGNEKVLTYYTNLIFDCTLRLQLRFTISYE